VDGTEKRQALRPLPRQKINYKFNREDEVENRKIENFVRSGRFKTRTALPVWQDGTVLTAAVTAGDLVINVGSTVNRDFRALGEQGLAVIRVSDDSNEVFSVSSFTATTITSANNLLNSWPVGTEVYPVRIANFSKDVSQTLWRINAREMDLFFDIRTGRSFADETGFPVYKTIMVFDDAIGMSGSTYSREYRYEFKELGGPIALNSPRSIRNFPAVPSDFTLFYETRAEFVLIRRFLHARRGKQKSFWMSSRRDDFNLNGDETVLGNTVKTSISNYEEIFDEGNYVDIKVEYSDGAVDYREVTQVDLTAGVQELITVDTDFSQIMNAANVARISQLVKYRLDSDVVTFEFEYPHVGAVKFRVMELVE